MEKFPGIHYNIICRSVNCEMRGKSGEAAAIRRSDSETQQKELVPALNNPAFIWAVLDKIMRDERGYEFTREVNNLTRVWKAKNPRPK